MQGYNKLVLPPTNLTSSVHQWNWSPDYQQAFDMVKHNLTHAPVLSIRDYTTPFEVVPDASGYALGTVLLQERRPAAYESGKMIPAERNYTVTEQEMLGVMHTLSTLR